MGFPPKVYQFLVGTFAALGSFLYGYDLTIVAEGESSCAHYIAKFNPFAETDRYLSLKQWYLVGLF